MKTNTHLLRFAPSTRLLTRATRHISIFAFVIIFTGSVGWLQGEEAAPKPFSQYVDADGNISLPDDFETRFVHLGSIAVASKKNEPIGDLHNTYTRREDLEAFQQNGEFPDGAILVKEVRSATSAMMTTGHANFATNVKIWFVMVKDAEERFKENDLWGSGWGWGLFEAGDRKTQVAVDYRTDCRTCHVPARKTDWIFTQCYPALKKK